MLNLLDNDILDVCGTLLPKVFNALISSSAFRINYNSIRALRALFLNISNMVGIAPANGILK